jgi:hypothetical protein
MHIEARILELFESVRGRHVFAVVPFSGGGVDPAEAEMLRRYHESGSLEIALHGYTHALHEFENRPYKTQLQELQDGKAHLEAATGARVRTFIPPCNEYDPRTVAAMEATGLEILSASYWSSGEGAVAYAPATVSNLRTVREAVDAARASDDPSPIVVAYYHPYEFVEFPGPGPLEGRPPHISLEEFEDLVRWLAAQPDVALVSFTDLLDSEEDLSHARRTQNNLRNLRGDLVPPWIPRSMRPQPTGVYHSRQYLAGRLWAPTVLLWGSYAPVALMVASGAAALCLVFGRRQALQRWAAATAILPLGTLLLLSSYDYRWTAKWKGVLAFSIATGWCVGVVAGMAWRRYRLARARVRVG